jgi:hypothetical protein
MSEQMNKNPDLQAVLDALVLPDDYDIDPAEWDAALRRSFDFGCDWLEHFAMGPMGVNVVGESIKNACREMARLRVAEVSPAAPAGARDEALASAAAPEPDLHSSGLVDADEYFGKPLAVIAPDAGRAGVDALRDAAEAIRSCNEFSVGGCTAYEHADKLEALARPHAAARTPIARVVAGLLDRKEIVRDDDGAYIFAPSDLRGFEPWLLRAVADKLDELNAAARTDHAGAEPRGVTGDDLTNLYGFLQTIEADLEGLTPFNTGDFDTIREQLDGAKQIVERELAPPRPAARAETPCPECAGSTAAHGTLITDGPEEMRKCLSCGHVFQNPPPAARAAGDAADDGRHHARRTASFRTPANVRGRRERGDGEVEGQDGAAHAAGEVAPAPAAGGSEGKDERHEHGTRLRPMSEAD